MHNLAMRATSLVFLGGAIGAILRWQIGLLYPNDFWSLMLVNTFGSLAIGILSSLKSTDLVRAFWQTGILGSFTSMSAVIAIISPNLSSPESVLAISVTFIAAPISVVLGTKLMKLQSL